MATYVPLALVLEINTVMSTEKEAAGAIAAAAAIAGDVAIVIAMDLKMAMGRGRAMELAGKTDLVLANFICDAVIAYPSNVFHINGLDGYETFAEGNKVFIRPKWIPCNEREPTEAGRYLVAYDYNESYSNGEHWVDIVNWIDDLGWNISPFSQNIVYWMKLPPCPPQKKDNKDV